MGIEVLQPAPSSAKEPRPLLAPLSHSGFHMPAPADLPESEREPLRLEAARAHWGMGAPVGFVPMPPSVASSDQVPAGMPARWLIERTLQLAAELPFDWQPYGPRLAAGASRASAQAAFDLAQDEQALLLASALEGQPAEPVRLGITLLGPLTLAAVLALPAGEKALADPGAVRYLAQALAEGVSAAADRLSRSSGAQVQIFLSEPLLGSVASGRIPTASGWQNYAPWDAERIREAAEPFAAVEHAVALVDADSPQANDAQAWMAQHLGASAVHLRAPAWSPVFAERVLRALQRMPQVLLSGPQSSVHDQQNSTREQQSIEEAFEQAGLEQNQREQLGLWSSEGSSPLGSAEHGGWERARRRSERFEQWRHPAS